MWIIINEVKYLNLKLQFPMDSLCFVSFVITVNVFPWCLCAKFWTCLSVWGECSHCFHIHCIVKWLNSQQVNQLCPMCRQDWKFKSDMETAGTWLVESWSHDIDLLLQWMLLIWVEEERSTVNEEWFIQEYCDISDIEYSVQDLTIFPFEQANI